MPRDMILLFDAIIAALGLYLIYSAWKMKKSGEISAFLVSPECIPKCRDKKAFLESICKKTFFFGMLSVAFGVLCCVNDRVYGFGRFFDVGSVAAYLLAWFWFSREIRKGMAKYF